MKEDVLNKFENPVVIDRKQEGNERIDIVEVVENATTTIAKETKKIPYHSWYRNLPLTFCVVGGSIVVFSLGYTAGLIKGLSGGRDDKNLSYQGAFFEHVGNVGAVVCSFSAGVFSGVFSYLIKIIKNKITFVATRFPTEDTVLFKKNKELLVKCPKLLDGLVKQDLTVLPQLQEFLIAALSLSEEQRKACLKNLCLIPFKDELKHFNLEDLKNAGTILDWGHLKDALKKDKKDRISVKRLKIGLEQLTKAWMGGWLKNKETEIQIDKEFLLEIQEHFKKHEVRNHSDVEEIFKSIRMNQINNWFNQEISPGEKDWSKLIFNELRNGWMNSVMCLDYGKQSILIKKFKENQLDDKKRLPKEFTSKLKLNEENLRKSIEEGMKDPKVDRVFQTYVSGMTGMRGKDKVQNLYTDWLNTKLPTEVHTQIDNFAHQLLEEKNSKLFENLGDLHTEVKTSAIEFLLRFREKGLLPSSPKMALIKRITKILLNEGYTKEDEKTVSEEILKRFKAEKLEKELMNKCLEFLTKPLKDLKQYLDRPNEFFSRKDSQEIDVHVFEGESSETGDDGVAKISSMQNLSEQTPKQ